MKNRYFIISLLCFAVFNICPKLKAQVTDDFQTIGNVNFAAATNWQRYNGSMWVAAGSAPTSTTSQTITISSGHIATITNTISLDQLIIESTGILDYSGGTLTIADGTGVDLTIFGTFKHNRGAAAPYAAATILVKTGGVLEIDNNSPASSHYMTSSNITYETNAVCFWNTNSLFASSGQTFFPNSITTIPIFRTVGIGGSVGGGSNTNIQGILEVVTSANDLTWQGTGTKIFRNGITGTGNVIQGVAPAVMTTSGQFQITGTNAKLGGTGAINLNANGLLIETTAEVSMISNKSIGVQGGTPTFTVAGILDCGAFNLIAGAGTSNFTLNSSATLKIGSPNGITSTGGTTGNIQLTGTRTYNPAANYEYKGTAAQVTGNGLPTTLNAILTINNTAATPTVTQTAATQTMSGTSSQMVLTAGNYAIAANTLVFQLANVPITRTGGRIGTIATSNITFGTSGNLLGNTFTLPNDLFVTPTTLNNFTINRDNNLVLGNQGFSVAGMLSVSTIMMSDGAADLDINGNNIDLGATGTLSEQRGLSRVVFDNTVTDFDAIKGGFIRATSRNLNGTNIAGLGIDITNGTAGTVNIDRYHCKVKGIPVESIKKVFDITASVAANNATMTITYSPQDLIGTTLSDATANFRLHRGKSGMISPWTMQTSPAAIGACHIIGARTVFADNITSFSPWSAAPETTILPVNLIFFKATKQQNSSVILTWQTATEENHNTFEIQKSIYDDNFVTIGFVKNIDKQNSNIVKNYSFLDNQCLQTSYYRLKQIDNDGKVTYSKIESIAMNLSDNQDFAIMPNPFTNKVSINTSLAKDTFISIYLTDLLGMSLDNFEGKLADIELKLCKRIENLPSGVYLISVWNERNKIVQRIIKQ